jgi:hypothetical protein
MGLDNVPRCQHVKVNGTQCGSPALRWRRQCFFHERIRRERAKIAAQAMGPRAFDLPLLEDANSVQVALMKVIQMLGSGRMDHKTAGLMLYALQTASVNLRNVDFEVEEVTDVVIDRDDVNRTSINGPQWFEEDFEDEAVVAENDEEDEDEDDGTVKNEADGKDAAVVLQAKAQAKAESVPKKPAQADHVSVEEARTKVRGVIRDWLLQTVGDKPQ